MEKVPKMGTIRLMKLADYLLQNDLSPAEFTRLLGLSSSATIRRYMLGERLPREEILLRIIQATGGKVTREDFISGGVSQAVIAKKGRQKRFMYCNFSAGFVRSVDEQQLQDFGLEGWYMHAAANENISFPVWQAKQALQCRLEIESNGNLILDGRRVAMKQAIIEANQVLRDLNKPSIYYPCLNPIHSSRKSG